MRCFLVASALLLGTAACFVRERPCTAPHDWYPFCNTSLSVDVRVRDLVSRIKDADKPALLTARGHPRGNITALPYIGVPAYDWGLNCLHGVQSTCVNGTCPTSFPCPVSFGASWNRTLTREMGRVIGTEARALWLAGAREASTWSGRALIGLDCWSPNININRDPRWGRNQEVATEDPTLGAWYAVDHVSSLQRAMSSKYLTAVATLKHWDAYSLEDSDGFQRYNFDASVTPYDFADTYSPAFEAAVRHADAKGVMCSYNAVNGVPSCGNSFLRDHLRGRWNFTGYITSDTPAISCMYERCGGFPGHNYSTSGPAAVTTAMTNGTTDVCSGPDYIQHIPTAVAEGSLRQSTVDDALARTLTLRFQLGLFDPPAAPFSDLRLSDVQSPESVARAREAAAQGIVLLKNDKHALPLAPNPSEPRSLALIGPAANQSAALLPNYLGWLCPGGDHDLSCVETLLHAVVATASEKWNVTFAQGSTHVETTEELLAHAAAVAAAATDIVMAVGLNQQLEAEMHDRVNLTLPPAQAKLIAVVRKANPAARLTLVLFNGGSLSLDDQLPHVDAVLEAWYPGAFGATAVARTLFGLENPGGKLPVTVYPASYAAAINMSDMQMARGVGRSYKYYRGVPQFPFGFGLSYTTFAFTATTTTRGDSLEFSVAVRNAGSIDGTEVVQVYFAAVNASWQHPIRQLLHAERVAVPSGGAHIVTQTVRVDQLCTVSATGDRLVRAGTYNVTVSNGVELICAETVVVLTTHVCSAERR